MCLKLLATVASAAVASTLLAYAPASASLVVGAPGNGGNYIPFGSIAGFPEYQQVYASSDFSGTITIDDLQFFTAAGGMGTPNPGNFIISLSTTSAPVNGLSTSLSQNMGPDNKTVYNAALPAVQNGVLTIPFSTPFTYTPAGGNLLVDLVAATPYSGGPAFEFNSIANGVFSRAYSGMTIPVANNSGLVTGFSTPVPEPSTLAMMALGFAGLGLARYSRVAQERDSGRVTLCLFSRLRRMPPSPGGVFVTDRARRTENARNSLPLGRFSSPQDLVGAARLLCSDSVSYLNSANPVCDGGFSRARPPIRALRSS
jgi:hypothetical protein